MATVVIVPGSFMPADVYQIQIDSLERHGMPALTVPLASVGRRPQGAASMTDDANGVIAAVEPLLDEGKEVVLLTHSYGAIPGTQSLAQLSKKAREAAGKKGGIRTVVYLASVILAVGTSNYDLFGEALASFMTVEGDYMSLDPAMVAASTFADLPADETARWAAKASVHSLPSFKEKLTYAGYNDVDVHYILTERDQVVPPELQSGMIELIQKSSGRQVVVHRLDSDHGPVISRFEDISAIVEKVAKS